MAAEEKATRLKKRKSKKQKGQVEIPVAPPPSPGPPVISEPKLGSPRLFCPGTPSPDVDPAASGEKRVGNQAEAAPLLELVEETEGKEEKKKPKRSRHGKEAACPSQSAIAGTPISVGEDKTAIVSLEQGKRKRRRAKEQEQLNQSPLPFDDHPQGVKQAAEGPKCENVAVWSSRKKSRMPSNRMIIRMRIEARKQQPLPEGLLDALEKSGNPSTNSIENNSNHSSPLDAFFDQFCYKPDRQQNRNSPSFPKTLAGSPPPGRLTFEPSQLSANATSKSAKTPILNASVSLPQEVLAANPSTNSIENTSDHSSPFGASFDQFCYKPDREPNRNSPSFSKTSDGLARSPPRGRLSFEPSQLSANATSRAAKTPILNASVSLPQEALVTNPSTNSIENNSNHASPLDQFCYKPDRQPNRNSPSFPKTPNRPARSSARSRLSSDASQLSANGTSKATKTPILNTLVSLSQDALVAKKDNEKAMKEMNNKKKQSKPKPLLRTAEKFSDVYRRLPLDQLVAPPRSPHKLLQEKYASDPWKVIVICMLLNLTQGKQVRKKTKGFFKRYPDPQTACRADPAKMAEYLAPLGLQNVKTKRIQRFSEEYVENDWTYITQLCGVGKYAADAYAIFCAGRATEVVPEDHRLVDYWKYVCFELPFILVGISTEGSMNHSYF